MKKKKETDPPVDGESKPEVDPVEENQNEPPVGLECRKCGCRHFYTIETRQQTNAIVRRRECRYCGRRLTTREKVVG